MSGSEVITYVVKATNLLTAFGIRKNCLSSGRRPHFTDI
jgi:hypothetical protein